MKRFWDRVNKTKTCWLWTGGLKSGGYGSFYSDGRSHAAHRFAYELEVGPIPEGLTLDHLCRVRTCVNPLHLEPVTRKVNTLRGIGPTALHKRKTRCPEGHEYDETNTRIRPNGGRDCRECHRTRLTGDAATKKSCPVCGSGIHPRGMARHIRRMHNA